MKFNVLDIINLIKEKKFDDQQFIDFRNYYAAMSDRAEFSYRNIKPDATDDEVVNYHISTGITGKLSEKLFVTYYDQCKQWNYNSNDIGHWNTERTPDELNQPDFSYINKAGETVKVEFKSYGDWEEANAAEKHLAEIKSEYEYNATCYCEKYKRKKFHNADLIVVWSRYNNQIIVYYTDEAGNWNYWFDDNFNNSDAAFEMRKQFRNWKINIGDLNEHNKTL